MKAWVLHRAGDIRLEIIQEPEIGTDEALIQVKAAGICGSDIQRVFDTGAHVHPLIIGHEFSGTVVRVGAEADPAWLGRRVGVYPLIPCRECACCKKGQYELCRAYSYLGSRGNGGFAEYAAVPVRNLVELPQGVSFEAAAMLEPMAVAVHAMRRAVPIGTDIAAVCGLGTIGLLLLMFLREAGMEKVLAIGNKDFQRRKALEIGLPEDCYYDIRRGAADKWIMDRTRGMRADVFFECVGRNETVAQAVRGTAPGGRICLVGNPGSSMALEREVYWKLLRNQLTVTGTWNSSFEAAAFRQPAAGCADRTEGSLCGSGKKTVQGQEEDDWQYVLERLSAGTVKPESLISHRMPLKELMDGLRIMRDKSDEYGKIMCVF